MYYVKFFTNIIWTREDLGEYEKNEKNRIFRKP